MMKAYCEYKGRESIKPVSECVSVSEVLATLNHLVKELNGIEGVKASMSVGEVDETHKDKAN